MLSSQHALTIMSPPPDRCYGNTVTVTAMAGTDLTHTDCGFEAVYLPPPLVRAAPEQCSDSLPAAPPGNAAAGSSSREAAAARGLQRAMVAAVTSLDGLGKQLCLESEPRLCWTTQ
jgi:hypothetical protein